MNLPDSRDERRALLAVLLSRAERGAILSREQALFRPLLAAEMLAADQAEKRAEAAEQKLASAHRRDHAADSTRYAHDGARIAAAEQRANDAERDLRRRRGIDNTERAEEAEANYRGACKTIAAMHAAAVGEQRGPTRGVVEDIEDLRAHAEAVEEALDTVEHCLTVNAAWRHHMQRRAATLTAEQAVHVCTEPTQ